MSTISAKDVKRLRDTTGVGMMDCKKALQEANGDFDAAIELLRKKGQKVADKRAEREASEGVITVATTDDNTVGVIVEVNSETDFVARNDDFTGYADKITDLILNERPADRDAALALDFDGGRTLGESVTDMTGKIGEKIDVRRFEVVEASAGNQIVTYIHPGAKLGVLLELNCESDFVARTEDFQGLARDIAMHVAATSPRFVRREEVDEDAISKEREIQRDRALKEGKPEKIVDKIVEGRMGKFYEEVVLLEQPFVKDNSKSVQDLITDMVAKLGEKIAIGRVARFKIGEES